MTWKPVRIADLDAETRRKAEENMAFWGVKPKRVEVSSAGAEPEDLRKVETNDWYHRGEDCPF